MGSRAGSRSVRTTIEATVVAGGRLYLFTLLHDRTDARAVFDAFAATIDLTPETAVELPGPDDDLRLADLRLLLQVSRPRVGSQPATELWDPVTSRRLADGRN